MEQGGIRYLGLDVDAAAQPLVLLRTFPKNYLKFFFLSIIIENLTKNYCLS
jgi:hypothetical protein